MIWFGLNNIGKYNIQKALYTNIPDNEGIAAVKWKNDNYTKKTVARKVITIFLALILTLNNFIFNSKFYHQIKAVLWEHNMRCYIRTKIHVWVRRERDIYPLIKHKSGSYLRFMDDIFMVWAKSESKRKSFINEINKKTSIHKICL